jgi:hypothetical protein
MAKPAKLPQPDPPSPNAGDNTQKPFKLPEWFTPVVTVIGIVLANAIAALGLVLTVVFHYGASQEKSSDDHINTLVDNKLSPAVEKINENTDKKLGLINDQLRDLNRLVGQLQGTVGTVSSQQQKTNLRLDQQKSVANLMAPDRVLRTIRAEIQVARASNESLPTPTLIDYKNAVQALPASAFDYWRTVADIINYQSFLNQMNHKAPDPREVSHPCSFLTEGMGQGNLIQGVPIRNCILDLDTTHNVLDRLVVRDSVVRYHGGPVEMRDVTFVNCYFDLDLSKFPSQKAPAHPEVLLALLDSNQQRVSLSTSHAEKVPN